MNGQITYYDVHFRNGRKIKEKTDRLYVLDQYLRENPLDTIRKIVFWIENTFHDPHYPYRGRTLTLLHTPQGFQFVFYYWYRANGYRVEYSNEHKRADIRCLMDTLSTISSFQTSLFPHLIDPCL